MRDKRIAVLMGGSSSEREVSLVSGRECAKALREAGFTSVSEIDVSQAIASVLMDARIEICFNALHGPLGEDGSIQGLLNVLGIPYTHSGVRASAIAMDKQVTKTIAAAIGIRCPSGSLMDERMFRSHRFDQPYVIKPINEGSSVHTYVVADPYRPPFDIWPYRGLALVEELISGVELTVAVVDGRALTVTEIIPATSFYDYDAKYTPGGSRHVLPANIPPAIFQECRNWAGKMHSELGCRGVTRSDFIYSPADNNQGLYFLEINTQPGMTPTSLTPEQARHCGIEFPDLVSLLIATASTD